MSNPITYEVKVYPSGDKYWHLNGKLHREDGPAVEYPNGTKYWYLNGGPHREDGPAIEYSNGDKYWHLNGKLHRGDGPAIEDSNGDTKWYLNGKRYTQREFNLEISKRRNTCEGKIVEVDGKKFKLVEV